MPPSAKDKEANAALVASLPVRDQVDLLAQALLREFMHRKGFKKTLQTFDKECPRDERTVSSRIIMKKLLNIPVEGRASRLVAKPAAAGGAPQQPTFMEEMCSYRLTKRDYVLEAKRSKKSKKDGEDTAAADPSDTEMERLQSNARKRQSQRASAVEDLQLYKELKADRDRRKEKKKNKKREGKRKNKESSHGGTEEANDSSESDSDGDNNSNNTFNNGSREGSFSKPLSALDAFAMYTEADSGIHNSNNNNKLTSLTSLGGPGPVVGSAWAPPGAGFDPMSTSRDTAASLPMGGGKAMKSLSAAALSERPSFLMGDGVTVSGSSQPNKNSPLAVRRDEILDTWRPGGGSTSAAAGGSGSALGSSGRKDFGFGGGPQLGFRAGGGAGFGAPSPSGGGSAGILRSGAAAHYSSDASPHSQPYVPGGEHMYDPKAQPRSSALAGATGSNSNDNSATLRHGIGFRNAMGTEGSSPLSSSGRKERKVRLLID